MTSAGTPPVATGTKRAGARHSPGVPGRPGDGPLARHVFSGDPHGDIHLGAVLQQPGVGVLHTHQHGHHRHGLHAAGDHHILLSAADGVGGGGNGLQTGGAEAVHSLSSDTVRQTGPLHDEPGHIGALDAKGHGTAHNYITDILGLQLGHLIQHTQQSLGTVFHRMDIGKRALIGFTIRSAATGHNNSFSQFFLRHTLHSFPILCITILR